MSTDADYSEILPIDLANYGKEKHNLAAVSDAMTLAHQRNRKGQPPLAPVEPRLRKGIEDESDSFHKGFKKVHGNNGGAFSLTDPDAGARVQHVSSKLERLAKGILQRRIPEVRRLQDLDDIDAEFEKQNPEFYPKKKK